MNAKLVLNANGFWLYVPYSDALIVDPDARRVFVAKVVGIIYDLKLRNEAVTYLPTGFSVQVHCFDYEKMDHIRNGLVDLGYSVSEKGAWDP